MRCIERVRFTFPIYAAMADEFPTGSDLAQGFGVRTMLAVPLMR